MPEREAAFSKWIANAKASEVYVYHTGFLAIDRGVYIGDISDGGLFIPNPEVDTVARMAIDASDAEKVYLFQRKLHDKVYDYIAIKRSKYRRNW